VSRLTALVETKHRNPTLPPKLKNKGSFGERVGHPPEKNYVELIASARMIATAKMRSMAPMK
jgi:hypothetical protein